MGKYRYTNPDAHGYLMEAAACKKVCKEMDRLVAKYNRTIEREKTARKSKGLEKENCRNQSQTFRHRGRMI